MARLFRVIIHETPHTKTGRDWPVKRQYRKRAFRGGSALNPFSQTTQSSSIRTPDSAAVVAAII
jgi:hypothetical protein